MYLVLNQHAHKNAALHKHECKVTHLCSEQEVVLLIDGKIVVIEQQ